MLLGGGKPRASVPGAVLTGGAERTASAGGGEREKGMERERPVPSVLRRGGAGSGHGCLPSHPSCVPRAAWPARVVKQRWDSAWGHLSAPLVLDLAPLLGAVVKHWVGPQSSGPHPGPRVLHLQPDQGYLGLLGWAGARRGVQRTCKFCAGLSVGVGDACQASFLVCYRSWAGSLACR